MQAVDLVPRMRALVADALALDEDEVRAESRLMADLKADSLDFVDILFQIDKTFGVKLQPADLDFVRRLGGAETGEGQLDADTVDRLSEFLPALRDEPDPASATPARLFSLISVDTLCRVVAQEQARLA